MAVLILEQEPGPLPGGRGVASTLVSWVRIGPHGYNIFR
jgi:hypothetical protein